LAQATEDPEAPRPTAPVPSSSVARAPMAASLVRLSVAAALLGAAAAQAAQEDAAALLQVGASVERSEDACKCLVWKDVYSQHGVECGAGQELTWAGGMDTKPFLGEEFCSHFYEKVSHSLCVNLHFNEQRSEQWCYVSPECEALNGGGAVGSLKWKQCTPGQDLMLGQMAPEEVHGVAVSDNKDAGLILKMAYPIYQAEMKWPAVKECLADMGGEGCTTLQSVQAAGKPMIFDSEDGHPPFGVVVGSKALESHFTPWFFQTVKSKVEDLWISPGKMNDYECVSGCSQ